MPRKLKKRNFNAFDNTFLKRVKKRAALQYDLIQKSDLSGAL